MKLEKKFIIIAFGFFFLIFIAYQLFYRQDSPRKNELIFGIATGYAPFISLNESGIYEGFDIDVAYAIGEKLDKKIIFKDLGSMTSLFVALENNMIDAIIWGLSITEARTKRVKMIQYQGDTVTSYPLLFWKKIPDSIKSISDMNNMTICVETHSSQEAVLDKYPTVIKKLIDKVDDALLYIQYQKADAALVEPAIAQKFKKRFPELILLDTPLAKEDQVFGVGIAVLYKNNDLIKEIESAIQQLKHKGIIEKYEKKWGIS